MVQEFVSWVARNIQALSSLIHLAWLGLPFEMEFGLVCDSFDDCYCKVSLSSKWWARSRNVGNEFPSIVHVEQGTLSVVKP